ncbi:hypothetical protein ACTA71_003777 [Dictyostelium dimigraforme]
MQVRWFKPLTCINKVESSNPVLQPKIPSSAPPSVAIQFPSFPSNLRLIGQVCSRKSSGRKRNPKCQLITDIIATQANLGQAKWEDAILKRLGNILMANLIATIIEKENNCEDSVRTHLSCKSLYQITSKNIKR